MNLQRPAMCCRFPSQELFEGGYKDITILSLSLGATRTFEATSRFLALDLWTLGVLYISISLLSRASRERFEMCVAVCSSLHR